MFEGTTQAYIDNQPDALTEIILGQGQNLRDEIEDYVTLSIDELINDKDGLSFAWDTVDLCLHDDSMNWLDF